MTIARIALVLTVATLASACDPDTQDTRYAQLENLEADFETVVAEPSESALDLLEQMAEDEPCTILGGLIGTYENGNVVMAALNDDRDMTASIFGTSTDPDVAPDQWLGIFKTHSEETGTLRGTLLGPDEIHEFGVLTGDLVSDVDPTEVRGHVFGVFDRNPNNADAPGRLFGAYALCE